MTRGRLFVIMPFGVKAAGPSREPFDFDQVYHEVLRPLATQAGWEVLRIDEVTEPGPITTQAFRQLFAADLVIADVTSANSNVYYELGIRQALSPSGTVLVALAGTELPFDIANQRVLFYQPDFTSDRNFADRYVEALNTEAAGGPTASPVRQTLEQLGLVVPGPAQDAAGFERELELKVGRARNADQLVSVWHWAKSFSPLPVAPLLDLADRLADAAEYQDALKVLEALPDEADRDYEVHRKKGFVLRNLNQFPAAEQEFRRALDINPGDAETLGMLGGSYKRQRRYAEALDCYEKGMTLRPASLYMRVNHAAMAVLESPASPQRGMQLYRELGDYVAAEPKQRDDPWAAIVRAEAEFAIGDQGAAKTMIEHAFRTGAGPLHFRSLGDQLELLAATGFRAAAAAELVTLLRRLDTGIPDVPPSKKTSGQPSARKLLVHLSDPHFGWGEREGKPVFMHRFRDTENSYTLSAELTGELTRAMRDNYRIEDVVLVVSGDLTYAGKSEEFVLVENFLVELCGSLGLGRDQVVLVPGNHDIDWQAAADRRFDNYLGFVRTFYGKDAFREFYPLVQWNFEINSPRPNANQIVYYKQHGQLLVVGLNSCIYETNQHHYGFIGRRQLDHVDRLLEGVTEPTVKAAVMHHHLHPFPEASDPQGDKEVWVDMSTVRDAGLVEQRLEQMGFDLVLHGHKHKPQLRETLVTDRLAEGNTETRTLTRSLIVSGAGSVGVNATELDQSEANHFALIEVLTPSREGGANFLDIRWLELSYRAGARWADAGRWTLKG
jgi:3',5'-cyclic AMP phosphodiesterase CpdA/tetratricopeptide (TPR) repeat protein